MSTPERGRGGREARRAVLYTETPRALKARARPTAAGRNVAGVKLNGTSHVSLLNVPGKANPADAFTKHVSPKRLWQEYMARMYNSPVGVLAKMTA